MNHINNKYINDGNENSLGISFPIILRDIPDEYCIGIEAVAKKPEVLTDFYRTFKRETTK